MQELFSSVEVDYRKTRKKVYKLFDRYRYLIELLPLEVSPRLTQNFSFIPPSTKQTLNGIESIVDKKLERQKLEDEFNRMSQLIDNGLNILSAEERIILIRRYLLKDNDTDWKIYNDLHLGRSKYYDIKKKAVNKLGFHFKMEVYKK
ncbi:ArpU family phage packaging/lysis transcriptional regulator [Staphylococcus xylosus]